jgi:multidrug efflux pump subunit AcrA (membrane-fusion protein)
MCVSIAALSPPAAAQSADQGADQNAKQAEPPAPSGRAIDVAAVPAKELEWQEKISAIGIAESLQGVDVSGSEAGLVAEIFFDSGKTVAAGDPLVRLDSSKEEADLKATQAQIPAAKADLDRKLKLVKERVVSQSDLDVAESRYDELNAQAISLKATIDRRLLTAPFGGILGSLLAYVAFDGFRAATMNWQTFSQVAFAFDVTPRLMIMAAVYALFIGLIGGLFPAIRAARTPVAMALRER